MGVIDKEQFTETFQYFDNEIVVEIINIFLNEYPERIVAITESIKNVDYDSLKFNSHSIKGVIANFVAPTVVEQAKQLEIMGSDTNMDGADEVFAAFKISSALLVEELTEIKEEFV
jgi:HPt (histidine-containing phosphotransfer) domain-containing protein